MSRLGITVLIVSLCVLAATGGLLAANTQIAHEEFEENITLSKEGATNATLCVQNLTLCPSTSRTYTVHLKCKASGTYRILLDYEEKNDGGLKPFVNVTVRVGGEDAWQGTLAELLDGQTVPTLTGELQAKEPFDVQVIYTMPEQVGNEAQDTFSDFEIHFITIYFFCFWSRKSYIYRTIMINCFFNSPFCFSII